MNVGIIGFGTIGRALALKLQDRDVPLDLVAIASRDMMKAKAFAARLDRAPAVCSIDELIGSADVIVDCAPTAAFEHIATGTLDAAKILVTVNGAALLQHPQMQDLARKTGGRIILATGALLGLDAVRAAALGTIHSVNMITRKPPKSLVTAEYVVKNRIDLTALEEPLKLFCGSAREGAAAFPANVNVAAALGLAGIGPDRTMLEIWADPALERNTHRIIVDADSARLELAIENVPTQENPGTGKITALSILAALRALVVPVHIGS